MSPEFREWPSIPRLSREMIVTEKLDGTNAQITITEDGELYAGSRTRWITPQDDNFGFALWCEDRKAELVAGLGVGTHYGEWFGKGIQRNYGLAERRFALFNTSRWHSLFNIRQTAANTRETHRCVECPACDVVPVLAVSMFDTVLADTMLHNLSALGSAAAPGFMKPEGIVVYHVKGNVLFKKTLDRNDGAKGG